MLLIQSQEALATFFYIGGFLVSFLVIREVMKPDWRLSLNILNRALRLLPSFLFIILFFIAYYSHLGSGQLWNGNNPPLGGFENCYQIWKVILFIDNFYMFGGQMCYTVAWYLYPDMQLFVISMFVFKLYPNHRKACKILILVLIFVSVLQLFIYSEVTGFIDGILMT
jgi:peptidoglycan/LPS O-acetylase OafA/YrhL